MNLKDELIVPSKDQLMQRPRDFADNIEKEIHFYSDVILKPLEVRNDTFISRSSCRSSLMPSPSPEVGLVNRYLLLSQDVLIKYTTPNQITSSLQVTR